jgi:penicillin-binding protein 2
MRGQRFQPRLVRAVRDSSTGAVAVLPPKPLPTVQVRDPALWDVVIDGMVGVMSPGGTAYRAQAGAPYQMAGKTGTAQVFTVGQNEKYRESEVAERLRDHALFIAFAPAEAPKLAIAVLVENGRSGSGTAAPIARKVFDAYLVPAAAAEAPAAAATMPPAGGAEE